MHDEMLPNVGGKPEQAGAQREPKNGKLIGTKAIPVDHVFANGDIVVYTRPWRLLSAEDCRFVERISSDHYVTRYCDDGVEAYAGSFKRLRDLYELPIYEALADEPESYNGFIAAAAQNGLQPFDGFRKHAPVYDGFIKYFPDAIAAVAELSKVANEQHNPGEPIHWAKEKSSDEWNALLSHILKRADGDEFDEDGIRHTAKMAWRALAWCQREIDEAKK